MMSATQGVYFSQPNSGEFMKGKYFAHTRPNAGPEDWQPLEDHLAGVADLAGRFSSRLSAAELGHLAGLWHDLGKYSETFQNYISAAGNNGTQPVVKRGSVDHSSAGAQHANSLLGQQGKWAELYSLAYVILGHHAGLPVGKSNELSCVWERLRKTIEPYGDNAFDAILHPFVLPRVSAPKCFGEGEGFARMFFIRMLFSALVDADFLDTEAFIDSSRSKDRGQQHVGIGQLRVTLERHIDGLQSGVPAGGVGDRKGAVNEVRKEVVNACRLRATEPPGFFSLTVPTGGGKTLSSLAFSLAHAERWGLDRVIYAVPYTSIIEQNADVFRDVFKDEYGAGVVLQHHSNFVADDQDQWSKLAAENWDARLVVTTNVQLFESLFAHRTSKCRKIHNMANSVIVLDEAQMLPVGQLRPTLAALRTLVEDYRCTVVVCTATQPALNKRPDFPTGLPHVREIIERPASLYERLKRVEANVLGETTVEQLADRIAEERQALCIVNTKRRAAELYECLRGIGVQGLFHLSAAMCPTHRSGTLSTIRHTLHSGRACSVVSTQLIEAGVDIDFPTVYREIAGIDSLAQAAGRCNREGTLPGLGRLNVFWTEDALPPGMLRNTAQTARRIMPEGGDILSLDVVERYYKELLFDKDTDATGVFALANDAKRNARMNFDFPEIAHRYRLISEESESVVIPFDDDACRLVGALESGFGKREILRKLQPYVVQVRRRRLRELLAAGAVRIVDGTVTVLEQGEMYDPVLGLLPRDPNDRDPQELMG